MKGKIPTTGFITIDSDKAQWLVLVRGLINELRTTAVIERAPGVKVRINLKIKNILSPDLIVCRNSNHVNTNLGNHTSLGVKRILDFFYNYLDKNSWIFMGVIDGENEVPILIIFYESIGLAFYSQKVQSDDGYFLPELN